MQVLLNLQQMYVGYYRDFKRKKIFKYVKLTSSIIYKIRAQEEGSGAVRTK